MKEKGDLGSVEITTTSDIVKEIKVGKGVGRGTIKDFIINEKYGNGYFVIEGYGSEKPESVSCSNIRNMALLLQDYFGGVIDSSRIIDKKRYIGKEIFFSLDRKGRINHFTPINLVPKKIIKSYNKSYNKSLKEKEE